MVVGRQRSVIASFLQETAKKILTSYHSELNKPVTGKEPFFAVSYGKPALVQKSKFNYENWQNN